ncbi:MAG: hypothetical protein HRT47_06140 [Candidatus Caenarcaniphilales bacterium]|nr:hypothetical protein [Candidatus Caenarcaniphilales bacterium]
MISNFTPTKNTDLLIVTGRTWSGKDSVKQELALKKPIGIHMVRPVQIKVFNSEPGRTNYEQMKALNEIEPDHPLALSNQPEASDVLQETTNSLQQAANSGEKLAITFADPKDVPKIETIFKGINPKANINKVLLMKTSQPGIESNKLLQISNKNIPYAKNVAKAKINFDQLAEERAYRSQRTAENASASEIDSEINRFLEPELKTIKDGLENNEYDFLIQNPGIGPDEKDYGLKNAMKQIDQLIRLLTSSKESQKLIEKNNNKELIAA